MNKLLRLLTLATIGICFGVFPFAFAGAQKTAKVECLNGVHKIPAPALIRTALIDKLKVYLDRRGRALCFRDLSRPMKLEKGKRIRRQSHPLLSFSDRHGRVESDVIGAFDTNTGKQVWTTTVERSEYSWGTPVCANADGGGWIANALPI